MLHIGHMDIHTGLGGALQIKGENILLIRYRPLYYTLYTEPHQGFTGLHSVRETICVVFNIVRSYNYIGAVGCRSVRKIYITRSQRSMGPKWENVAEYQIPSEVIY